MTSISAPVPPPPIIPASVAPDAGTAADLAPRKVDLIGLSRAELVTEMARMQLPRFRADQLWHWIYHKGVTDFSAMTTLAKPLRANLSGYYTIGRLAVSSRQESQDGTIKWLFRLADGHEIETVFIPEDDRGTLCISSQVGCTLNCRFCHTGTQRLVRNLTAGEIVGQLMAVFDDLADWPSGRDNRYVTSIVMMGMGEPLYNYDNVRTALKIIMDEAGIALSRRRITLSTTGIIPQMQACGEELAVNLAVSLHAVTDALRDELVPINRKYPIAEVLAACRAYPRATNARRITFEYVMLKDVNDSQADAEALVKLIAGIPAKVNLIPFNPWPGSLYETSDAATIEAFARVVMRAGYASPVRKPRGRDILAACGQLKSASERQRRGAANRRPADAAE